MMPRNATGRFLLIIMTAIALVLVASSAIYYITLYSIFQPSSQQKGVNNEYKQTWDVVPVYPQATNIKKLAPTGSGAGIDTVDMSYLITYNFPKSVKMGDVFDYILSTPLPSGWEWGTFNNGYNKKLFILKNKSLSKDFLLDFLIQCGKYQISVDSDSLLKSCEKLNLNPKDPTLIISKAFASYQEEYQQSKQK